MSPAPVSQQTKTKTSQVLPLSFLWQNVILAVLLVAAIGPGPLTHNGFILSDQHTDLINQFVAWRAYAVNALSQGHLPLWNAFVYGGAPFLGGFQSAIFYPPNLIYLILPLGLAINWSIFLHLWIAGVGMTVWGNRRGLHPIAALACGVLLMLGGRMMTHVFAGHLAQILTMAWAPWLFVSIDGWFRRRDFRFILSAAAFVALQCLGGHIQYAYYIAISAGLYSLFGLFRQRSLKLAGGLLAIYPMAFLLIAIQFLPAIAAAGESVRSGGVDFSFASMFSFPPENLLTLVAPYFFGDNVQLPYWGRCYLWEMSIFFGATGALLGFYGAFIKDGQRGRTDLWMTLILFVLALGVNLPWVPVFNVLYNVVPGFDMFRCVAKFTFPASLFFILCVGRALDRLFLGQAPRAPLAIVGLIAAVICLLAAGQIKSHPNLIIDFMLWVQKTKESYLPLSVIQDSGFQKAAVQCAHLSMIIAAAAFGIGAILIFFSRSRWVWVGLVCFLSLEVAYAAHRIAVRTPLSAIAEQHLIDLIKQHPGDYRVLNLLQPNNGIFLGKPDVWGNDPGVLKRYAEFLTYSQGEDPNKASQYLSIRKESPFFAMIRLRYIFSPDPDGRLRVTETPSAMERFFLVSKYRVLKDRDAILAALNDPLFDPREEVILESEPIIKPEKIVTPPEARILLDTPDRVVIQIRNKEPAILIMSDNYSRDWKVRALPKSTQVTYDLLPADYTLRAIPLAAGEHKLEIAYRPASLTYGFIISIISLLAWAGALFYWPRLPEFRRHLASLVEPDPAP